MDFTIKMKIANAISRKMTELTEEVFEGMSGDVTLKQEEKMEKILDSLASYLFEVYEANEK